MPVDAMNWGSYLEERPIAVWEQFGVCQQGLIDAIEHHLFFWGFTSPSLLLPSLPLIVIFYFASITFPFSRDEFRGFISDSLPYPTGVEGE